MVKIITQLTDFRSFYPAQMKGVILTRLADKAQEITFVDIAHDIPPQDVRAGAFALLSTARYFPCGTIHIYVDRFGNLILNMRNLPAFNVSLKGIKLKPVRTYAQARRIEPLITQGSHGFAEIAVNQGNAAEAFCLKAGDRVELEEI